MANEFTCRQSGNRGQFLTLHLSSGAETQQLVAITSTDAQGGVSSTEPSLLTTVASLRMDADARMPARLELGFAGLDQQVILIIHEAVRITAPALPEGFLAEQV